MSAEELTTKYIKAMEKTLDSMRQIKGPITVNDDCINEVVNYVKAYLKDAKYFREQEKFETSLTSIAYCEGLLDALKLIKAVNTEPTF